MGTRYPFTGWLGGYGCLKSIKLRDIDDFIVWPAKFWVPNVYIHMLNFTIIVHLKIYRQPPDGRPKMFSGPASTYTHTVRREVLFSISELAQVELIAIELFR